MALAVGRVEVHLTTIVERAAALLHARVWATDAQGAVLASSEPGALGRPTPLRSLLAHDASEQGRVATQAVTQAPIFLEQCGEVTLTIEFLSAEERISPHLTQVVVDLIVNQATLIAGAPDHHELKNQFVYNLLFESAMDEAMLVRQGQVLGIDLMIPRAAILIDATDYLLTINDGGRSEVDEAQMRRRTQRIITSIVSFFHLPSDTICAYVGSGEVVVLKAASARDLLAWSDRGQTPAPSLLGEGVEGFAPSWAGLAALKRAGAALLARLRHDTDADISLGIGRYHPGVRGLARSYQDARAALSLGRRFHGANQLHCLDALGIAAFIGVADERTKVDLAQHLLSPLDHEPELLETVEAFFGANCSPSVTSNKLCIHRNTLNYRLEKVASLTGLDPRQFDEAVQIRLALLLRSLQK